MISPDMQKYLIQDGSVFTDYKSNKNKITYAYMGLQDKPILVYGVFQNNY